MVLATQEAEAEGSLENEDAVSCVHATALQPGNKAKMSKKKTKKRKVKRSFRKLRVKTKQQQKKKQKKRD